jgi:hypothetical protein
LQPTSVIAFCAAAGGVQLPIGDYEAVKAIAIRLRVDPASFSMNTLNRVREGGMSMIGGHIR